MSEGTILGLGTVFAFAAFIGVCIWAYSSKRKKDFDEAANLPFVGDDLKEDNDDHKG